jgi:ribosomal protein S16
MLQDKEKVIDVTIKNNDKEENVKIVVKKPNNAIMSQAQRIGAKSWTDCVRDGIMTKKELEKFMKEQGIWDDGKDEEQKKIVQEISDLEKQLYVGGANKGTKLKASEGKEIAIKMRIKRGELRDLIAERMSLEQNTAESISDNSRFDFLVSNCTYYENGNKVYTSLDDYRDKADSEIGFAAATALASMLYSVDKNFEAKLPENKFLKMFNFVNDDLSLVNDKGETVDLDGRRIDKNGYYIDSNGSRVDRDGNPLDEFGNYIPTVTYLDEKNNAIVQESSVKVEAETKKTKTKPTVS